jgi:hypothetical protein
MDQLPAEFRPRYVLDFVIFAASKAASKTIQRILEILWPNLAFVSQNASLILIVKLRGDCARTEAMRSRSKLLRRRSI